MSANDDSSPRYCHGFGKTKPQGPRRIVTPSSLWGTKLGATCRGSTLCCSGSLRPAPLCKLADSIHYVFPSCPKYEPQAPRFSQKAALKNVFTISSFIAIFDMIGEWALVNLFTLRIYAQTSLPASLCAYRRSRVGRIFSIVDVLSYDSLAPAEKETREDSERV